MSQQQQELTPEQQSDINEAGANEKIIEQDATIEFLRQRVVMLNARIRQSERERDHYKAVAEAHEQAIAQAKARQAAEATEKQEPEEPVPVITNVV